MNVTALNLTTNIKGRDILLHPTLIEANNRHFLVDCGYEESFEELSGLLSDNNVTISQLHGILISHDDIDHIGALYKIKQTNPGVIVFASTIEEPSLSGKVKSERLVQAEKLFPHLPDEHKPWALDFQHSLKSIRRIPIDKKLEDGDILENEIVVVHTPGHTKGHICFYIESLKVLIANDAFVYDDGKFTIANPEFTLDLEEAVNSVRKLTSFRIEKVICYHGGEVTGEIQKMLNDLVQKFQTGIP